jgi:hypothetical protein
LKLLVLGHVIDGRTTVPAIAAALGMATTKVRDALAATVSALSAPNLTAAAAQALRTGLWIPPQLAPVQRGWLGSHAHFAQRHARAKPKIDAILSVIGSCVRAERGYERMTQKGPPNRRPDRPGLIS